MHARARNLFHFSRDVLKDFKKPRSETVNLKLKNPELARTLRTVAKAGSANPFYNGSIAQEIVKVIKENGGTMTLEDLRNYKPIIRKPLKVRLGNQTLYTSPPPSSGAILARILKILKGKPDGYKFIITIIGQGLPRLLSLSPSSDTTATTQPQATPLIYSPTPTYIHSHHILPAPATTTMHIGNHAISNHQSRHLQSYATTIIIIMSVNCTIVLLI